MGSRIGRTVLEASGLDRLLAQGRDLALGPITPRGRREGADGAARGADGADGRLRRTPADGLRLSLSAESLARAARSSTSTNTAATDSETRVGTNTAATDSETRVGTSTTATDSETRVGTTGDATASSEGRESFVASPGNPAPSDRTAPARGDAVASTVPPMRRRALEAYRNVQAAPVGERFRGYA